MPKHIAILGGGIAGLAAAYELTQLQRQGADITFTLIEASNRLGGILETDRRSTPEGEFIVELGPDGWVSDKPWARELAIELSLEEQLLPSNDAGRVTWIWQDNRLQPMPDGMRMMVPSDLHCIQQSSLFSAEAVAAYASEPTRAAELKRLAPDHDESVASFVRRHFGEEVLCTIGAPLLGGVFGGDVEQLSVRAVMKPFVEMEQEHGSLILALQHKAEQRSSSSPGETRSIFTSLRTGTGALAEAMASALSCPGQQTSLSASAMGSLHVRTAAGSLHFIRRAIGLSRTGSRWRIATERNVRSAGNSPLTIEADHLLLALPVLRARELLRDLDTRAFELMRMQTSSAAVVAFGFTAEQQVEWPEGFGFLVPPATDSGGSLLAATFCDQKYAHRAPVGARLIRAYYGGLDIAEDGSDLPKWAMRPLPYANARLDLQRILGPLPEPAFQVERVWHRALPQYSVGHLNRMAELETRIARFGTLHLLGNGYRGVGLPDLIRDARSAARAAAQ